MMTVAEAGEISTDASGVTSPAPDALIDDNSIFSTHATAPLNNGVSFEPFILVRLLPNPAVASEYTGGKVWDLSNNGIAVGYLNSRDPLHPLPELPFMFTAATDTIEMLDLGNGAYDHGEATSISQDGTKIAGLAFDHARSFNVAVTWDASTGMMTSARTDESHWNAVNDDGDLAGAFFTGLHFESLVSDSHGLHYPAAGSEGEATGINQTEYVCGYYVTQINQQSYDRAYRSHWDSTSTLPLDYLDLGNNPQTFDGAGGLCINNAGDIAGYGIKDHYLGYHTPAMWKMFSLNPAVYKVVPSLPWGEPSCDALGINSHTEMCVSIETGFGVALWTADYSDPDHIINEAHVITGDNDFPGLILRPDAENRIDFATCINDDLWVGGSYYATPAGGDEPCLVIPYNINNNKDANGDWWPDYREIIASGMLGAGDYNDDRDPGWPWLIDEGENMPDYPTDPDHPHQPGGMRTGLNMPGYTDAYTPDIADTQIVRLQVGANNPDYVNSDIPDDGYFVNGIIADSYSQCLPFNTAINDWGHLPDGHGREIVIDLRSNFNAGDPDHDYLCDPVHVNLGTGVTKSDVLANLHTFAYRYAHCIDWVQLGNESYDATDDNGGEYMIYPDQVGNCFGGIDPVEFSAIDSTCIQSAIDALHDWQYQQMWAILEGSALAGRPLRIVGPGITNKTITDADPQLQNNEWKEISDAIELCNYYQAWFDVHVHYMTIGDVGEAFTKITNPYNWSNQIRPNHLACLEWAPELDIHTGWWQNGADVLFPEYFGDCTAQLSPWDTYIAGWQDSQFHGSPDFGMQSIITELYSAYPNGYNLDLTCYGTTRQLPPAQRDPLFDLGVLRAQNVCPEYLPGHETDKLTALKIKYETAAALHQIIDFNPHPVDVNCTTCGGN